ncbi:hypothetical protein VSDG_06226 [Cytospora chrysosperma]|uniref:CFEM domain-containing protein n=1 Tax=Cytospora chrysosperma TaxID=252740 RepID=A0A423VSJ6_CYTCH|nr:hypothetical protein VSDG_06226 [Valsa sordida]
MGAIRFLLPALLAITGLVNAQSFGDLSSCGQNCINNMRLSTPCVPVTDQCLCENTNFQAGIRDCATQACTAADATAAIDYANSFCVSALAVSTTAAATSEAPTTTDAPTTTAADETTATPASSAEATSSAASSIATESSTTAAASTETTGFSTSTTSSAATETSSTETGSETSASTQTSASSAASASSTAGAAAAPTTQGLSVAGKAGVAVGAGAAGVALLALALAMCKSKRARRSLPRGTMQISEPLPGSGRIDYNDNSARNPNRPQPNLTTPGSKLSTTFNMAELEHARPYEEMVPRVTPRRMV